MDDFYRTLGVRPGATLAEIKRAYREKAKVLHPDLSGDVSRSDEFARVVQAYRVLSDARQRSIFDESFFVRARRNGPAGKSFDYRTWLLGRDDDESRSKLIFYDLMHQREDEAVAEFKRMQMSRSGFSLKKWFTREDFMDYGYILAEELVIRGEYYDAVILLEQIVAMEKTFHYFKLFFPEVMDFSLNIFRRNIEGAVSDELAIDVWERALEFGFSPSDDAFFLRRMAEAYRRIGDSRTADICLSEADRLAPEQ